jgi:hypothetical protein
MAQKTYKQIQDEANRLFGKGASDKKFEWRRQQQEAAGLEQEKKTRGGVAGAYDRNKALVQAAVPLIAGALIPGSSMIAGALAGGAARGLDREGKGGIGLDLGQAAKGAFTGAVMGNLGGAARTGIQGMMAGGGLKPMPAPGAGVTTVGGQAPGAVTGMPGMGAGAGAPLKAMPQMGRGVTSLGERVAGALGGPGASAGVTPASVPLTSRLGAGAMEMAGKAGSYLAKRPEIAATALTTTAQARQAAANRRLQEQQLAQNQQQFEQEFGLRKGEQEREVERQRRIAQMLAPLFQRISGGQG